MHDSSAQTKPDEQAEELEIVDDFDATLSFGTPRSRPGRYQEGRCTLPEPRRLDEFWTSLE